MLRARSAVTLLLLAVLVASPARGQRGSAPSSFPLLEMDASTRGAAMGGALSAVYDGADASTLFYHPALPSERTHNTVAASYLNHLADLNAGFLSYSRRLGSVGTASAGLRFFSYGDIEGRDAQGFETSDFGASQVAVTLGLARGLSGSIRGGRVRYGANVHVVHGSIENAGATALAADLGALYHLPAQQLTVSASINNLGGAPDDYYGNSTALPADLRLGVSKRLAHLPLRLSVTGFDLQAPGEGGPDGASSFEQVMRHLALGAELEPVDALALRVGYGYRRHQELAQSDRRVDPAGLSAGFGLSIQRISVDYAFSSWSVLGGLHQFGLRARL
jgi:hypothetical protein